MKKSITLIILMCIAFLGACSQKNELILVDSETVVSFLNENGGIKFLYVGRPTCENCQEYQPIVEAVINEIDVEVFYYNTDDNREDEIFDEIIEQLDLVAVPTIIKIKNGKVVDEMIGVQTMEYTTDFFQK